MLSCRSKITIVIPCYNESSRLHFEEFEWFLKDNEQVGFCFVNDGSSDNTSQLLHEFARKNEKQILIVDLENNSGKAEAVRRGVLRSIDEGADFVGYWDADLATPLAEIEYFMAEFAKNEDVLLVTGCRLKRLGTRVRRNLFRHYIGRVFATWVSAMLRLPVYDTQCGAKIMKSEIGKSLFGKPFKSRWLFDVEVLRRMVKLIGHWECEHKIVECPLNTWIDIPGSKLSFKRMLMVPFIILKIFLSRD